MPGRAGWHQEDQKPRFPGTGGSGERRSKPYQAVPGGRTSRFPGTRRGSGNPVRAPQCRTPYLTTLVTFPERMQRVQTLIRLEPPGVADRTGRRFGLNCRFETLLA